MNEVGEYIAIQEHVRQAMALADNLARDYQQQHRWGPHRAASYLHARLATLSGDIDDLIQMLEEEGKQHA